MNRRGILKFAVVEFRLNLRDPAIMFWSVIFPALAIAVMGAFLSKPMPDEEFGGLSFAAYMLPAAISLVIMASAFIGAPITLTTYRQTGVLRRLRVTPMGTLPLVLGFSLSQLVFMIVGMIILFITASLVLGIHVTGSWAALIGVIFLGMITMLSLGAAIGSIARSPGSSVALSWIFYLPMMYLSDMWVPIAVLPPWLQNVSRALPLTPVNTLLRDILYGGSVGDLWRIAILFGWMMVGVLISWRFFRWE